MGKDRLEIYTEHVVEYIVERVSRPAHMRKNEKVPCL
jgi:hypothetical protein